MRNMQKICDVLKDLTPDQQKPFRDALMIASENDWHDIVHTDFSEVIDMNTTDYTWYREDDLVASGYVHESDIMEQACNDIEGLCKQLLKEKTPQTIISIDALHALFVDKRKLSKLDKDLIQAILEEEGMI